MYIFDNSFLGADYVAVIQPMLGEINLGGRCLVLNLLNGPLYVCS